jgi:DNA invertase Pin-like site-specific DNA recombinase
VLALREAIHRHAIDAVIVYDLDRLMRDQDFLAMLYGEANFAGVEIEFVTAPQVDKTPEGTLLRNIMAYVAQKEHEKIRERIMRGHRARAEAGKIQPAGRPLYGYQWTADRTAYVPDEEHAAIVRQIFERSAAGASIRSITQELSALGIPTPTGGQVWRSSTVHSILKHPYYGGNAAAFRWLTRPHKTVDPLTGEQRTVYTNKERPPADQIPFPEGVVPPLVSAELAEAVQARLALNKAQAKRNNHNPEDSLLRSGVALCGYCDNNLVVTHRCGPAAYQCLQNEPGNAVYISARILDEAAWAAVRQVVLDPSIIAAELEKCRMDPPTTDLAKLEKRLQAISRQQDTLARRFGLVSDEASAPIATELERLAAQKHILQQRRDELLQQIKSWEEMQGQVNDIMAWCQIVAENLDTFTYAEKRNALVALRVEARVYRQEHDPRFEVEMHIPLGGNEFHRVRLGASESDCVQSAGRQWWCRARF